MNRAIALLGGMGLGARMMYLLDPQQSRCRRAIARDRMIRMAHEARDAKDVIVRDMQNRAQGLAAGDLSVLVGGHRALQHPLRGGWSPSARALMGMLGGGLFLFGLTRSAPQACVLGTIGLGLVAEGISNAGIEDITHLPEKVSAKATSIADRMGIGSLMSSDGRAKRPQPAAIGK
jgi:hypothetical protein